jgi:hypothetical protein
MYIKKYIYNFFLLFLILIIQGCNFEEYLKSVPLDEKLLENKDDEKSYLIINSAQLIKFDDQIFEFNNSTIRPVLYKYAVNSKKHKFVVEGRHEVETTQNFEGEISVTVTRYKKKKSYNIDFKPNYAYFTDNPSKGATLKKTKLLFSSIDNKRNLTINPIDFRLSVYDNKNILLNTYQLARFPEFAEKNSNSLCVAIKDGKFILIVDGIEDTNNVFSNAPENFQFSKNGINYLFSNKEYTSIFGATGSCKSNVYYNSELIEYLEFEEILFLQFINNTDYIYVGERYGDLTVKKNKDVLFPDVEFKEIFNLDTLSNSEKIFIHGKTENNNYFLQIGEDKIITKNRILNVKKNPYKAKIAYVIKYKNNNKTVRDVFYDSKKKGAYKGNIKDIQFGPNGDHIGYLEEFSNSYYIYVDFNKLKRIPRKREEKGTLYLKQDKVIFILENPETGAYQIHKVDYK